MPSPSFREFVDEALAIVQAAEKQALTLRLMGALAVSVHCPKYSRYHEQMDRVPTDIDFAALSNQKQKLTDFLENLGYRTNPILMSLPSYAEGKRFVFNGKTRVDVFLDELRMCHAIDWRRRLHVDNPTIPLADIILEKLQIVHINAKDIKDLIIIFLEHDVGASDQDTINALYVAKLLSKDWGFYYTATTNLNKTLELIDEYAKLPDDERSIATSRIRKLLNAIEKEPKTLGWKMRSRVGTKKQWYMDVVEDQVSMKVE